MKIAKTFYQVFLLALVLLFAASCQEDETSDLEDIQVDMAESFEAHENYLTVYINTLLKNGIDPEEMERIIFTGEIEKLNEVINNSHEVKMAKERVFKVDNLGDISDLYDEEYLEFKSKEILSWTKKQRLYAINNLYKRATDKTDSKFKSLECEEPEYSACNAACHAKYQTCKYLFGWSPVGVTLCEIDRGGCMLGCAFKYCYEEGEPDPNCPPTYNCPIEQG